MEIISKIILPLFVVIIVFYGVKKKINVYDAFLEGAKEGLVTTFSIFPAVIAMIFAINIFLDSNFLGFVIKLLSPVLGNVSLPIEIFPMAILRPVSGTASLAIVNDIFKSFGPDSFVGRLASILQGCTDTTVYVIALYFGTVKITKIKHSLWVGLFADLVGIIMAFVLTNLFF
ncbi:MAG: spore maturation protein [Firmicutes bacterium]|nr:spore maturation protein [Bacillota bacterium]